MQNKSYDRYVELLRAAELQTYERTSARFVATVGATATGTWITRNPIAAFFSAMSVIAISVIVAFNMQSGPTPDVATREAIARTIVAEQSAETTSTVQSFNEARVAAFPRTEEKTIGDSHLVAIAEQMLEIETALDADHVASIQSVAPMSATQPSTIESAQVSSIHLITQEIAMNDRDSHLWSFSLGMNSLPAVDRKYQFNMRATAMIDVGNGFAFGIGAGARSVSASTSEFAGFRDTVFTIGGEQLASKIGQYNTSESPLTHLEAGVAAAYQARWLFGSDRFTPSIAVFVGLEGRSIVLEQSLTMIWAMNDQFSAFGGASLREYPMTARAIRLDPVLGVRASF